MKKGAELSNLRWPLTLPARPWPKTWPRLAFSASAAVNAFLLVAITVLSLAGSTDPDFWWHLKTGELIVQSGRVPQVDPYSFTAAGQRWIAHEWLSEALIYLGYRAVGYVGLAVMFGLVLAFTFLIILRLLERLGLSLLARTALALYSLGMYLPLITVRPQLISWLLFAVYLYCLFLYLEGLASQIWILVPLMALWANLHGGYVAGLMLIALAWASLLFRRLRGQTTPSLKHLAFVGIGSGIAALFTPHGLDLLRYPFTYVGTSNGSMTFIQEWQSPNFHSPLWLLFAGSLLLLVVLGVGGSESDPWSAVLITTLAVMTLLSRRHVALYALAWVPVAGLSLRRVWGFARAWPTRPLSTPVTLLSIIALVVFAGSLTRFVVNRPWSQIGVTPQVRGTCAYPADGARYILENLPDARVLNEYAWGGYLIWAWYPYQRVFIDGRADMHGDAFLQEYMDVRQCRPNWRAILDKYEVNAALVEKGSPLSVLLSESRDWERVFVGPVEEIFVRRE
ncbi:MAG: hypothetical protein H5T64_02035 [Chloroflexi bacterium]|nr:hypothetical protein [Chloroflexota bacterium]